MSQFYFSNNTLYYISLFLRLGIDLFAIYYIYNLKYVRRNNNIRPYFLELILLALCVFAINGDYWTYMHWYNFGGKFDDHVEPIWNFIRDLIPKNYTLFRTVVWGTGLVLMSIIFDYYKVNKTLAFLIFGAFYIVLFGYARAAIALVFVVFGVTQFYRCKREYRSQVWRWLLFAFFTTVGVSMHRSMFLIVPALLLPFVVKLNLKSMIVLIILFPIFSLIFNQVFPYISYLISGNEFVGVSALKYLSGNYKSSRFWLELYPRLPILIYFIIALLKLYQQKEIPVSIMKVSSAAFFILYTCFLFASVGSANGITFFYRVFNMAYPFIIITITYTIQYVGQMQKTSLLFFIVIMLMLVIEIRYFMFINPNLINNQMMDRYFYD